MDDGLVLLIRNGQSSITGVLILIVVDDGLVLIYSVFNKIVKHSLNPYCSGRWSRTARQIADATNQTVLILIVVDDGLVRHNQRYIIK